MTASVGGGTGPSDYETLVRAALLGAGTSVWEWDPLTDVISGVDGDTTLLGYTPAENSRTQSAWDRIIHPDDLAENDAQYQRHARGETPFYEHEYRARAKDGQWRWIAERGRIVARTPDGRPLRVVGTISDVTQRREAESRVVAMTEHLSKTARHVPGVLYQYRHTSDGHSAFTYVSESCHTVLGVPAAELLRDGSKVLSMMDSEHLGSAVASMKTSARTLAPWRFDFRLRRPDGELRWISGASTPQREDDGAVIWHGYFEDTTDVHELHLAREATAVAQAANRAKTDFLSHMSHELRTPLNAVMGFAQLLQLDEGDPLSPNQRRRVGLIHEAGGHLLQMIGELLDLTRIESGNLALECVDVRLEPLLVDCVEMLRPSAETADVRLLPIDVSPSLAVHGDPMRLRQVVLNLVSNAIKYNRPGGSAHISAVAVPDGVLLRVADTGVGIAAEHLRSLGEPFNRLSHQRSVIEGTGIGLAVTRGLIELMAGRLDVQSALDEGSTFSVFLPAATDASAVGPASPYSTSLPT